MEHNPEEFKQRLKGGECVKTFSKEPLAIIKMKGRKGVHHVNNFENYLRYPTPPDYRKMLPDPDLMPVIFDCKYEGEKIVDVLYTYGVIAWGQKKFKRQVVAVRSDMFKKPVWSSQVSASTLMSQFKTWLKNVN